MMEATEMINRIIIAILLLSLRVAYASDTPSFSSRVIDILMRECDYSVRVDLLRREYAAAVQGERNVSRREHVAIFSHSRAMTHVAALFDAINSTSEAASIFGETLLHAALDPEMRTMIAYQLSTRTAACENMALLAQLDTERDHEIALYLALAFRESHPDRVLKLALEWYGQLRDSERMGREYPHAAETIILLASNDNPRAGKALMGILKFEYQSYSLAIEQLAVDALIRNRVAGSYDQFVRMIMSEEGDVVRVVKLASAAAEVAENQAQLRQVKVILQDARRNYVTDVYEDELLASALVRVDERIEKSGATTDSD